MFRLMAKKKNLEKIYFVCWMVSDLYVLVLTCLYKRKNICNYCSYIWIIFYLKWRKREYNGNNFVFVDTNQRFRKTFIDRLYGHSWDNETQSANPFISGVNFHLTKRLKFIKEDVEEANMMLHINCKNTYFLHHVNLSSLIR